MLFENARKIGFSSTSVLHPGSTVKWWRTLAFFLFSFFISSSCLYSQGQDSFNFFTHLPTSDGFSLNPVNSIAQDELGMIWLGTRNGLMRYDGHNLEVVRRESGDVSELRINDIFSISLDSGGVWMATKRGLSFFDPRQEKSTDFPFETNQRLSVSSSFVYDVMSPGSSEVWVATREGLNVLNIEQGEIEIYKHEINDEKSLSSDITTNIFQSRKGEIWVGTENGLNKSNREKSDQLSFKSYFPENSNEQTQGKFEVTCIKEDLIGNLWIGTKDGLFYFRTNEEKFERYGSQPGEEKLTNQLISAITLDHQNRLWVGTYDGVNVLDNNHKLLAKIRHDSRNPNSLNGKDVKALFTDRDGGVWISTYFGGINYWSDKQLNFEKIQEHFGTQLGYNVVSSFMEDKYSNIYIGTEGAGINVIQSGDGQFKNIDKLSEGNYIGSVKDLLYENTHQVWIATFNRGLIRYNLKNGNFEEYRYDPSLETSKSIPTNQLLELEKASDGKIWIGTLNRGLMLFDPQTRDFRLFTASLNKPEISNNNVRAITETTSGDLYVGTGRGVTFLSADSYQQGVFDFQILKMEDGQQSNLYVHDILESSSEHKIWVAANDFGLFYIKDDLLFPVSIPKITSVFAISEDREGKLWLSSEEGVVLYDPTTGNHRLFDRKDGVQPNEFNRRAKLFSSSGRMLFGGASGVTSFYPSKLQVESASAPKVVLTQFYISDRQIKVGDDTNILDNSIEYSKEITLDYDQNIFTIHFSMPNYVNSDKNTYLYRLKGLEDEWVRTTNSFVSYTIQRGGDYVFEVKGVNKDGIESKEIASLDITMKSAPWFTWWAYLLYSVIVLSGLMVFIFFFRSRLRLQHQLEMETREYEYQKELNQQKLQFFTNISHEFRTPLTLISAPLDKLIAEYKGPSAVFRQLQVIKKNTDHLFKLINELMDFRKLENKQMKLQAAEGNIVKFAKEIFLSFSQQAKLYELDYQFVTSDEEINVYFDRDKLEKVLYNLISNAFKYTPVGGKIEVRVQHAGNKVKVHVQDSGMGIPAEHLDKIFDRFYEVPTKGNKSKFKKGSGIGLAIAKNVMELHKGQLMVSSEEGKGSDFVMELHVGRENLSDDEVIESFFSSEEISNYIMPESEDEAGVLMENEERNTELEDAPKILIVEDNQEIGAFIQSVLSKTYRTVLIENGALGYQEAISSQPDLIISDVMMPVMDGIEFCGKVKSDLRTSHIPFILLTARTSLVYKYDGLESGADEFLSKPFDFRELLLKCRNILNTHEKLRKKIGETGEFISSEVSVNSRDEEMMKNAIQLIKDNIANEFFDIQYLTEELGISRSLLFTKFKAWTNQTPKDFILTVKMKKAASLIEQHKTNISEVGYIVGFKDPNYFSKAFKKHFGLSPKSYSERFKEELGLD
ncbi:hybrid sensor histidine kinase/response regulator transcription factor [Algoriphagus winogradskyi]|uniref:histidine kinase n=1 Tax=Algoriphagus winogradskyi TaxID=237017 RepID=A0ABY1P0Q3_9BACT|nr:two-component regulator propeller domain-containing protein [Algoriphagus winogradskyi]SMP21200.1 Two component regulator propeller [Algoriphagus winogradskyi]